LPPQQVSPGLQHWPLQQRAVGQHLVPHQISVARQQWPLSQWHAPGPSCRQMDRWLQQMPLQHGSAGSQQSEPHSAVPGGHAHSRTPVAPIRQLFFGLVQHRSVPHGRLFGGHTQS
jgi:hypothetical protein